MKNWKTTLAGIATLICLGADTSAKILSSQQLNFPAIAGTIAAAIGLIKAKDHDVTGGSRNQN